MSLQVKVLLFDYNNVNHIDRYDLFSENDTQVVIKYGNTSVCSKKIQNCNNPEWNDTFYFYYKPDIPLEFKVFETDNIFGDKQIEHIIIPVRSIKYINSSLRAYVRLEQNINILQKFLNNMKLLVYIQKRERMQKVICKALFDC